MHNQPSRLSPIPKKTWRKAQWCCALTGAWGVLTGYPLFILISEKSESIEGSSAIFHFFGVLVAAVAVVAVTEWLRDTIREKGVKEPRSVGSILISILLLTVFEVFVLAYEEVSQVGFESPYVLSEIAARISGEQTPYAFLRADDIKDPDGLLARLRMGRDQRETDSPESWIVQSLAHETEWTFFPDLVPRPAEHEERVARIAANQPHLPLEIHDMFPAPSGIFADPYVWEGQPHGSSFKTETVNPLSGDTAIADPVAETVEREPGVPVGDPEDEALVREGEALVRKVNVLSFMGPDGVPHSDTLSGSYNTTPVTAAVLDKITQPPGVLANKSGAELTRLETQALLAVELNRQIIYYDFYNPDVFRSVGAPPGVKAMLQHERDARGIYADIRARLEELKSSDSEEAKAERAELDETREHADSLLLPLRRLVWLNRQLLESAFPEAIAPASEPADPHNASLLALGLLWVLAGGALGWTLAKVIRDTHRGRSHPVRRGGVRGLIAALAVVPAAVVSYVLVFRAISVLRDLWRLRGEVAHLFSLPAASYDFGASSLFPVALRLALFRNHPWATLLGIIMLAGFLAALWFVMILADIPRWRRRLVGTGTASVFVIIVFLFDFNLIFIFLLVGLVWAIPSLFLGMSTPYLQTGSALPTTWGLIAMGSGIALVLLTLLRLIWEAVPWWLALLGVLIFLTGLLMRAGVKVEDYWPLAALVLALLVYGATAIVQGATFHGVLGDFHDLSVRGGSETNLWARAQVPKFLRTQESAPSYNPYEQLWKNLMEAKATGDPSLDRVVEGLEVWHADHLKKQRESVARQLELSIVGSLGFWLTVGLLAAWAIVRRPLLHE